MDLGANIIPARATRPMTASRIGVSLEVKNVAKNKSYAGIRAVPAPAP